MGIAICTVPCYGRQSLIGAPPPWSLSAHLTTTGPPGGAFRAPPPPPPPLMGNLPLGMHPPPPPPRCVLSCLLHQPVATHLDYFLSPLFLSLPVSCADQCILGCLLPHQEHLQDSHLLLLPLLHLLCSHGLTVFSSCIHFCHCNTST